MFMQDYTDDVTYWGSPVVDGWGVRTFVAPVVLKCRWEQHAEQFLDFTGTLSVSNAVVFVPVAVDLGGYLYLGISAASDPTTLHDAYPIRQLHEIPDLRKMFKERRAML